jgi:hypothetical protein
MLDGVGGGLSLDTVQASELRLTTFKGSEVKSCGKLPLRVPSVVIPQQPDTMESGSEEEIDIQYTDWESETDPTASESDEAFIDYEDEHIEMEGYDSSYVPTESEEGASFTSVSDYEETFDDVRSTLLVGWPAIYNL